MLFGKSAVAQKRAPLLMGLGKGNGHDPRIVYGKRHRGAHSGGEMSCQPSYRLVHTLVQDAITHTAVAQSQSPFYCSGGK